MRKIMQSMMLATVVAFGGASFTGTALAGSMDAEGSIKAAKEALKQADSVGGAWRDTKKMIEKAEKLLQQGKADEAKKLAEEAELQGMLGYMQATSQNQDNLHI